MLLALLEEGDTAVQACLRQDKIDLSKVHAQVRRALGMGEDRSWEGILVTPRVRKIVKLAESQAAGRSVEPLDLLVALREEGGGLAAGILREASDTTTTLQSQTHRSF